MTDLLKPVIGMQFNTEEEAYQFYNVYAGRTGFSVRKKYKNYCRQNPEVVTSRRYVCQAEGKKNVDPRRNDVKKPREDIRCGCDAMMGVVLDRKLNKLVIITFVEAHNHETHIEACAHMMRSQRSFPEAQAGMAELGRTSGLSLKHCFELMGNQLGGKEILGFMKDDMKRHLQTKRQRSMKYGEAALLLDYFQRKHADNPMYHYAFMLDGDQQITNIFWADARMIMDYSDFGDVLTFDTTYKTNNSHRPCAVFAGFNHQRKTVIFGGALMYDETAASFQWLFRTFLNCMNNVHPKTIFTDQAQAIAIALKNEMPDTHHGLCTWHLSQNLAKHHGKHLKEGITKMWWSCANDAMDSNTFDLEWKKMVDKFDVANDAWFVKTYDLRHKWAAAFMRTTLTLGMASTQVSESLNASLKDCLEVKYNIVEFFTHFSRVLRDKRYIELRSEFESRQKFASQSDLAYPMLLHANKIYTPEIYRRFRVEVEESLALNLLGSKGWEGGSLFRVAHYENLSNVFEVHGCKETQSVTCNCGTFEMCGYLCSHSIKLLDFFHIKQIPDQYILPRWLKTARSEIVVDFEHAMNKEVPPERRMSQRYHMMVPQFVKLAVRASESEEGTAHVAKVVTDLSKSLGDILQKKKSGSIDVPESEADVSNLDVCLMSTHNISPPNQINVPTPKGIAKNKGKNTNKRLRPWNEPVPKRRKTSILPNNAGGSNEGFVPLYDVQRQPPVTRIDVPMQEKDEEVYYPSAGSYIVMGDTDAGPFAPHNVGSNLRGSFTTLLMSQSHDPIDLASNR